MNGIIEDVTAHSVITLEAHIALMYSSEARVFASAYEVRTQKIKRWVDNNAVWVDGEVYLRKTNFNGFQDAEINEGDKAYYMSEIVNKQFDRNATRFAKHIGSTQQQVCRWLKTTTVVLKGQVYLQVSHFNDTDGG
jgi:hypothetical protein